MANIMIVDDEPTLQQLIAIILEDMGHVVVGQFYNGESALKAYESSDPKPELLIVDHRMPIMSGADLSRMVLEREPDQKILFLTADDSVKEFVSDLGMDHFLRKPVDIDTLKKAVEVCLSS